MSAFTRLNEFVQSAMVESKKVTWPSRQELVESTQVVVVATFIVMIFLFVVDRTFQFLLGLFMR
ncbi:MAG TPA: preprotein translocase subunit SecE [Dongiaceae bacterium]|jgi:preprotein translocase subunit SecE|nr:preprotein translocase subunit SecE [Dongiaceae bacterium]